MSNYINSGFDEQSNQPTVQKTIIIPANNQIQPEILSLDTVITAGRLATMSVDVRGEITPAHFYNAVSQIVNHIPGLSRTIQKGENGYVYFVASAQTGVAIEYYENSDPDVVFKALLLEKPDLSEGPLVRFAVVKGNPNRVMILGDHALVDGISLDVLMHNLLYIIANPQDSSELTKVPVEVKHSVDARKKRDAGRLLRTATQVMMSSVNSNQVDLFHRLSELPFEIFKLNIPSEYFVYIINKAKQLEITVNSVMIALMLRSLINIKFNAENNLLTAGSLRNMRNDFGFAKNQIGDIKDMDILVIQNPKSDLWQTAMAVANLSKKVNGKVSITKMLSGLTLPNIEPNSPEVITTTGKMAAVGPIISNWGVSSLHATYGEGETALKVEDISPFVETTPITPVQTVSVVSSPFSTNITVGQRSDTSNISNSHPAGKDIMTLDQLQLFTKEMYRILADSINDEISKISGEQ